MATRDQKRKRGASASEDLGWTLTSGDLARLMHVDLKTIHNWVAAEYLTGRRTEGRHLRFDRIEVVRFMRDFGYPIPKILSTASPTILFVDFPGNARRAGARSHQVFGAFDAALQLGTGLWEFAVVDLRVLSSRSLREWTRAVREADVTQTTGLIGVGASRPQRLAFLGAGADVVFPPNRQKILSPVIRWLIGATQSLPTGAVVSDDGGAGED